MRARKYPLDPLARLRAKQVADAALLLSEAVRARQEAERVERATLAQRDEASKQARAVNDGERAALERGELRVADLVRAVAWGVRVEAERAELERHVVGASARTRAATASEGTARDGLGSARAEAEVVTRDRTKWEELARQKDETAEEESAAEAFRGKPT